MDKYDRTTPWIAGLDKVELNATAACDPVIFHHVSFPSMLL
jgi:hypothetical protein